MTANIVALGNLSPGKDIDAYLHTVSSFPILGAEEEQTLARRFSEEGDLEAARQLVISHLRFVVHIARGYQGYGLAQADLIQEGNVGLMKAVKRFNPDVGVRLVSFAVHWIRAEIHEFILRNWRIVKVATTKAQRKLFFNLRGAKKQLAWLTKEETQAVARDLGVPVEEVTRMEGRLAGADISFDADDDDDDSGGYAPAHYLHAKHADPAEVVMEEDDQDASLDSLSLALSSLDTRSRDIVQRRWLQDDKATLHELAAEYGVSAERIRQIEQNAMKKLKASIAA
ncbi:MAG: RNA polymerase sigma factor RpoH [Pseudomonadales bacterium]|nr:RNA polymerase sigma factor RpoH [Pseudomonadales bacterium]MCP5183430.1 RNA polymerase sigma factor RpoH [Pseudomonadales bacterium]